MSVQIDISYGGQLHCTAIHAPSKTQLETDAPVDNQGRGESFSPTDLMATALGTCILTTMGIFAQRHDIDLQGARATVIKEMVATPIRRIGKLTTTIEMPITEDHPHRAALERAALTCPVHQSLHPDVEKPIEFRWAKA
ncbi:MAG: OsmC family protein [Chthoniobacteraceae bacterium]